MKLLIHKSKYIVIFAMHIQTITYRFMKDIIPAIPKSDLKKELTPDNFLRRTNFNDNEIYVFTAHDSPNLMKEIGRLREIAFRAAGGGTGKEVDIDSYDTAETPYKQLIVWDDKAEEILGGYRFLVLSDIPKGKHSDIKLATQGLFEFSEEFINDYLPYTIELGRSFVQPNLQSTGGGSRKTLFALDNLWDGLGALIVTNPGIKYFFGKVTMYTHYDKYSRDLLLHFLTKYFNDDKRLVYPVEPMEKYFELEELSSVLNKDTYEEDYKILSKIVRSKGETIPPLINTYMNLSPTMKCFGSAVNNHFGDVEETGILITISDIYESKKKRHQEY